MIVTIQIGLICTGCTGAQLQAAPLQALLGGRTFRIEASNAVKDTLRRSRFKPVTVDAEFVQGADGFRQGVMTISRIIQAAALGIPPPKAVAIVLERGGSSAPSPAFAQMVEVGPPPASNVVAITATEKAQLQLSITPQRAQTMMLTAPRGDGAPPNDSRGFIHKKIGGFIGTAVSTIFPPVAPVIAIGRGLLGGGGSVVQSCAPGFRRGPDGNCIRSGVTGAVERFLPGGATGLQPIMAGSGCPSGMHPNRSSYFTQSEGFIEKGTKCVSNRRRNPLNPRAARRSMSRLTALSKEMNRLEKTLRRIAPRR